MKASDIHRDLNEGIVLENSYLELSQGMFDIGFYSTFSNGIDYHHITRDITVSVQKIEKNKLYNMVYNNGSPMQIILSQKDYLPYLTDYIEWKYILSGHYRIRLDDEAADFHEGELCFFSNSTLHQEILNESDCTIINFNISRTFFNDSFINQIGISPLQKLLRANLLQLGYKDKYLRYKPDDGFSGQIKENVFTILSEGKLQLPGYQDICRGYIIRLVDLLTAKYRDTLSKTNSPVYYDVLFQSISSYIRQNASTLSMKDLTSAFHYGANFINHLVRKYTGLTYSEYLVRIRIEKSKDLLENTDLPVDKIIWLVGYHNRGYFYQKFQEATGLTPANYRRHVKKEVSVQV